MVPYDTVHMVTNQPTIGTWGSLTWDIAIFFYTTNPFYLFFYIIYSTGISEGEETAGDPYS